MFNAMLSVEYGRADLYGVIDFPRYSTNINYLLALKLQKVLTQALLSL
jgi:hypothetical protein